MAKRTSCAEYDNGIPSPASSLDSQTLNNRDGLFTRLMQLKATATSLHDPGCFGVFIDTLELCLKSICAEEREIVALKDAFVNLNDDRENVKETKNKRLSDLEKQLKNIIGLNREYENQIQQLETKVAMQEAQITQLKIIRDAQEKQVSHNGTLMWEITNYQQRKQEARTAGLASFYSDDFFSEYYGYRMCARVYLNGDGVGKGTHLSVFFAVKKGKHDDILTWPFKRKVQFTLMNQCGRSHLSDAFRSDISSSSFQKPVTDMNVASGCPLFVTHRSVENDGFLKNDTIWIRVTVNT